MRMSGRKAFFIGKTKRRTRRWIYTSGLFCVIDVHIKVTTIINYYCVLTTLLILMLHNWIIITKLYDHSGLYIVVILFFNLLPLGPTSLAWTSVHRQETKRDPSCVIRKHQAFNYGSNGCMASASLVHICSTYR